MGRRWRRISVSHKITDKINFLKCWIKLFKKKIHSSAGQSLHGSKKIEGILR